MGVEVGDAVVCRYFGQVYVKNKFWVKKFKFIG